ncbi:TlpA family protein disulfide reductase [Persicitalea jodogahamensis]|uniref:Thioredoxin domain-containing protein n=1 Tax=Persicitalea jodogahamensis TaxID=402147 RepID=A0A8J3D5B8_9BACT|nr:TlpA disulfide reductase family protein [Persicitalea jodogahamensis]GHB77426.1 hypothetical protein GCM10007390_34420 [Persicitalea jodogahamensis]
MKIVPVSLVLGVLSILWSCQQNEQAENHQEEMRTVEGVPALPDQNFKVDAEALLKDYLTWYGYHYRTIHLAQDFTALDTDSTQLSKQDFLTKLATGNYIALKTKVKAGVPVYTLYKSFRNDPSVQRTIKNLASIELKNLSWEGEQMPAFSFTDLEGNVYDNNSTKGKVLVLKCWFIGCVACVKEFPELNLLVDEYRANPDIQFVSLASDTKPQLESFLTKKPFKYATVSDQAIFMEKELSIKMYPTHLLINKEGKIVKVVNHANDLIPALRKETEKAALY